MFIFIKNNSAKKAGKDPSLPRSGAGGLLQTRLCCASAEYICHSVGCEDVGHWGRTTATSRSQPPAEHIPWSRVSSPHSGWAAPAAFNLVVEGPRSPRSTASTNGAPSGAWYRDVTSSRSALTSQAALEIRNVVYTAESSWEVLSDDRYLMTNEKPLKEKEVSLRPPKQRCPQAYTRGAALMHGRGDKLEEKRELRGRDQRGIFSFLYCFSLLLKQGCCWGSTLLNMSERSFRRWEAQ